MCRHSRAVTIPLISVAYIKQVREIYRKLEQKLKRNVTTEEISLELKKSAKLVKRIQQTDIPAISLNTNVFDDIELIDTIVDQEEKVDEKLVKFVEKLIDSLKDEREKEIIRMYFGLSNNDYGTSKTLEEISKKFGISRERVRQIKFDALKSLEKASEKIKIFDVKL
jgi:RNA polymerase primary sigma factor